MKRTSQLAVSADSTQNQPAKAERIDRLARILAGKPRVRLETDEYGHAIVDKEKHPRLYEWAVKG